MSGTHTNTVARVQDDKAEWGETENSSKQPSLKKNNMLSKKNYFGSRPNVKTHSLEPVPTSGVELAQM